MYYCGSGWENAIPPLIYTHRQIERYRDADTKIPTRTDKDRPTQTHTILAASMQIIPRFSIFGPHCLTHGA